jgi:NADH dehydrogenase (ubiquinone) 1 alpha/beta subcomplex 1
MRVAPFARSFASSSTSHSVGGAAAATFLPEGEVRDRVLAVVKQFPKVDALKVQPASNFISDLGLDSLDTVELVMLIEEEFVITIPDDIAEKILTSEDAVKFISAHPMAR